MTKWKRAGNTQVREAGAYRYSTLNEASHEISLLTILPSPFTTNARVILRTERLTDNHIPDYEALS